MTDLQYRSCLESNWRTRGECLLKCSLVCMQMCLQRLTFQNQRALINNEGVCSNLAQSLLLIKISQSHRLSETRPWNSICVHICSYQTLHLCWIYVPACRCVCFSLVAVLIFTSVGIFGCCSSVCAVQPWENKFPNPIWRIIWRFVAIPLTFKTLPVELLAAKLKVY